MQTLGFGGWDLYAPFLGLAGLAVLYNTLGFIALRRSKPRYLPLTGNAKKVA